MGKNRCSPRVLPAVEARPVAGGVLPPRDEELARTGHWLTSILATIEPAADRRLVQAYATNRRLTVVHIAGRRRGPAS